MARVNLLLQDAWNAELAKSGLEPVAMHAAADGQGVLCPACGTQAPLINGECSDCGLYLG